MRCIAVSKDGLAAVGNRVAELCRVALSAAAERHRLDEAGAADTAV